MAEIVMEEVGNDTMLSGVGLAPFFRCQTCGDKITADQPGIAVFERDNNGGYLGPFHLVHKLRPDCQQPWQAWPWQDIDMLMYELAINTGISWSKVEARRTQGREFGLNS